MIRKYLLPLLALAGAGIAAWTAAMGARPLPAATPVADPATPPFPRAIAGAGIVEASSENIDAASAVAGLVVQVFAVAGSRVKSGEPLLRLDDRELKAELAVREASLAASREKLARLKALPRAEDLAPLEARLREAEAAEADAKAMWDRVDAMPDKRAMAEEEISRRKFAAQSAAARVAEARAQLELTRAGAWAPDLRVAEAEIAAAESQKQAVEVALDRLVTRAPADAEVLQVNVRPGEYARTGDPLVVLGATDVLHVRVDVDENDAWRYRPGAAAVGYVRGNSELSAKLEFVRVEPFVVPKKSLTGASQERVDTRVMQVLYRFPRASLPVLVGQQMDVVIEAVGK
jgi:multidrug efflux pump subunit AcrA (membrane-fusion protein)